jgi:hypothetical protein
MAPGEEDRSYSGQGLKPPAAPLPQWAAKLTAGQRAALSPPGQSPAAVADAVEMGWRPRHKSEQEAGLEGHATHGANGAQVLDRSRTASKL